MEVEYDQQIHNCFADYFDMNSIKNGKASAVSTHRAVVEVVPKQVHQEFPKTLYPHEVQHTPSREVTNKPVTKPSVTQEAV